MSDDQPTIDAYRDRLARTISEAELLDNVTDAAERFGWLWHHTSDSRRTHGRGFPDLVMVRKAERIGQPSDILVVELKTETRFATQDQINWLDHFRSAGIETAIWRPTQWLDGTILERLARGRAEAWPRTPESLFG